MCRLIDADKLDSYIKEKLGGNKAEYELFATMIDNQPTAFDVEEVVREMEDYAQYLDDDNDADVVAENLINIVKGAVKE